MIGSLRVSKRISVDIWGECMKFLSKRLAIEDRKKQYSIFSHRLKHKVSILPKEAGYFLMNIALVEKALLEPSYNKYLQSYKSQQFSLEPGDVSIVNELEQTGICITSLDALCVPNTEKFWAAAQQLCNELAETAAAPSGKGKDKIRATGAQFVKYSDVYHWGLEERLLNIVERYLKVPAAYGHPMFSLHVAEWSHERSGYWHRDREDRRMLKIGVYFSDVDRESGPFEYVRPEDTAALFKRLQQKYPFMQTYKTLLHSPLEKLLDSEADWLQPCTGKAGTVVLFDPTRVYHRGKPPEKSNRFATFFGYHSRRPTYPFSCGLSHFSSKDAHSLAAPLSERQRDCINWRDELTGVAKMALQF
ncbi:MAG: hypothetical protein AAFP07_02405 [Cyanobacteria bacterium J06606_4]